MGMFGITMLIISFIGAAGVLGAAALVIACSVTLCILLMVLVLLLDAADAVSARLNEKPAQKAKRLRMKEENRKRRRERFKHPLSF